jgi:2EXR family
MMEFRLTYPNFALIPTKRTHAPTTLHSFKKLRTEIRLDIWKQAIEDSPGMLHCIQPFYINHPPLAQACHESRQEIKQYYYLRRSQQEQEQGHKDFRFYIDYEKDTLYLNHKFNLSGRKTLDLSGALESSTKYYRHWLSPVKFLPINLKEGRKLVDSASGTVGLWSMLYVACPKLETLIIVVDGPVNNRKAVFQKLRKVAGPEDLGSHNK